MAAAAGLVADLSLDHPDGRATLSALQRAGIVVASAVGGAGVGLLVSSALASAPVIAQTVVVAAAGAIVAFAIDETLTRVLETRLAA